MLKTSTDTDEESSYDALIQSRKKRRTLTQRIRRKKNQSSSNVYVDLNRREANRIEKIEADVDVETERDDDHHNEDDDDEHSIDGNHDDDENSIDDNHDDDEHSIDDNHDDDEHSIDDNHDDDEHNSCTDNEKLHEHTEVKTKEFMATLLQLMRTNNFNSKQLNAILKLIKIILPQNNNCPLTMKTIFKRLNFFDGIEKREFFVCMKCSNLLGVEQALKKAACVRLCNNCHSEAVKFYTFSILDQVGCILSSSNNLDQIKNASKINTTDSRSTAIESEIYQDFLTKNTNNFDLVVSLNLNTDGAPITNSRGLTMWPVVATIVELNQTSRDKFNNLITIGLWLNAVKPNYQLFLLTALKEFIDKIQYKIHMICGNLI
jgi:hypothetical protein